ncbi:MAG: DUF421 domain-containing protein [Erysipelotrichaceae bacterium]|nr:DUF421 domain-containing protein [Erysipelotrichaceae bacterium]MBQ9841044.1 DUF421 domain-containing protein [Erysipelotrichaceae bacterium]
MEVYVILVFRCTFFYFVITALLRIMGKREVGELSVFDIVVYFVMSELLAISISDPNEDMLKTLIPIVTLTILQVSLSWLMMKMQKVRNIVDGRPVFIITHGKLNIEEMRKQRYTIDDLCSQLRINGILDIEEVEFALLENSGDLSVIEKSKCQLLWPEPLISDGVVQKKALDAIGKSEVWLNDQLLKNKVDNSNKVFLCLWKKDGLWLIMK